MKSTDTKSKDTKSKDKTTFTATVAVKKALKNVTPKLRKQILQRDQSCQFKNPHTGKICGSKYFLEIDHIKPRHLNGENSAENLRVLCKNHNIYRYRANL